MSDALRFLHDMTRTCRLVTTARRFAARALPLFAAAVALAPATLLAQSYPTKTVRIVVPYSVGLGPDVVARTLADSLSRRWGQSVVVDNRPGASGMIALAEVRKVADDGHTLFVGDAGALAVAPYLMASPPYDAGRDFAPITTLFRATFVLWTRTESRFGSLEALLREARANPRKVSYASLGNGHPTQLAVETFARAAGIELLHVPFKDAGQMITSITNGDVDLTVLSVHSAAGMEKAGKWRPLAVGAKQRLKDRPDIPTLAEAGGPPLELAPWAALLAAASTPPAILKRVHDDVREALAGPEVRGRIEAAGFEVLGSTPEALGQLIRSDTELFAPLIRDGVVAPL